MELQHVIRSVVDGASPVEKGVKISASRGMTNDIDVVRREIFLERNIAPSTLMPYLY